MRWSGETEKIGEVSEKYISLKYSSCVDRTYKKQFDHNGIGQSYVELYIRRQDENGLARLEMLFQSNPSPIFRNMSEFIVELNDQGTEPLGKYETIENGEQITVIIKDGRLHGTTVNGIMIEENKTIQQNYTIRQYLDYYLVTQKMIEQLDENKKYSFIIKRDGGDFFCIMESEGEMYPVDDVYKTFTTMSSAIHLGLDSSVYAELPKSGMMLVYPDNERYFYKY